MPTYRTTAGRVQEILADNYGPLRDGSSRTVEPYIRPANLLTTRVNTCATTRGYTLSTDELAEIEAWVACWYYVGSDPQFTNRSTVDASGSMAVSEETFLKRACSLDPSGCLQALMMGNRAGATWIGKRKSAQTDYVDRD